MQDLSGAQPVRRTVLGGLGDAHQQAESFLYKRTLLAISSCLRYGMASSKFEISKILSDILGKKLNDNDIMNISIDEHLSNIVGHIRTY